MPITAAQRARAQRAKTRRTRKSVNTKHGDDASDNVDAEADAAPLNGARPGERYRRGDHFERDTVFTIPLRSAENDDYAYNESTTDTDEGDAVADVESFVTEDAVMTGNNKAPTGNEKAAASHQEAIIQKRLKQLEQALPETARHIDNLSAPNRPGGCVAVSVARRPCFW